MEKPAHAQDPEYVKSGVAKAGVEKDKPRRKDCKYINRIG